GSGSDVHLTKVDVRVRPVAPREGEVLALTLRAGIPAGVRGGGDVVGGVNLGALAVIVSVDDVAVDPNLSAGTIPALPHLGFTTICFDDVVRATPSGCWRRRDRSRPNGRRALRWLRRGCNGRWSDREDRAGEHEKGGPK